MQKIPIILVISSVFTSAISACPCENRQQGSGIFRWRVLEWKGYPKLHQISLFPQLFSMFSIARKFRGIAWQFSNICRLYDSRISKYSLQENRFQLSVRDNFILIRDVQGRNGLPCKLASFVISHVVSYWRSTRDVFVSNVCMVNAFCLHKPN